MSGTACGTLLCREVRDAELHRARLDGVRLVFWLSVIAWNGRTDDPDSVVTREIARGCARTLGARVVQCNWANGPDRPELRGMGRQPGGLAGRRGAARMRDGRSGDGGGRGRVRGGGMGGGEGTGQG